LRAPEIVIIDCAPRLEAARLSDWRARVERAAETAHKKRTRDHLDDKIVRLQGKVGNMTMENEQLYAKIDRPDGGSP
jgi:hypothetical protein